MDKLLSAIHKGILKGLNEQNVNLLSDIDSDEQDYDITVKTVNQKYDAKVIAAIAGQQYVDLGLPSGTLWAKYPVKGNNANNLYFAWGETTPKSYYHQANYIYGDSDSLKGYSKYNNVDNKESLELSDDPVNAYMGGKWHMPTFEQINELYNECSNGHLVWTDSYDEKTGKTNGIYIYGNDNYLYLPYTGGMPNSTAIGIDGCCIIPTNELWNEHTINKFKGKYISDPRDNILHKHENPNKKFAIALMFGYNEDAELYRIELYRVRRYIGCAVFGVLDKLN